MLCCTIFICYFVSDHPEVYRIIFKVFWRLPRSHLHKSLATSLSSWSVTPLAN